VIGARQTLDRRAEVSARRRALSDTACAYLSIAATTAAIFAPVAWRAFT